MQSLIPKRSVYIPLALLAGLGFLGVTLTTTRGFAELPTTTAQDFRGYSTQGDNELAGKLKLSVEQVRLLRKQRNLTNGEIVYLAKSPAKLRRALQRSRLGDLPVQRAAFRALQQADERGKVPANALPNAIKQMERLRRQPVNGGGRMDAKRMVIPLAPAVQPNAAAAGGNETWFWLGPGNIGGRTRSIVIDPTEPKRMWAGSVGGGIWTTDDGGQSWAPADDFMASLAVSCMVMDPKDPKTLYAGTGESFASWLDADPGQLGFSPDGIRGAGIFRTTNGKDWSQLPATSGINFQYVNRLAMAPTAGGSVLLAATSKGLFRSEKATRDDWQPMLAGVDVADVAFHPTDGQKAIAGGRLNGSAYYSEDGGKNWQPATHSSPWRGRVEVVYARKDPVTYALTNTLITNPDTHMPVRLSKLYRSKDGGKSYSEMKTMTRDEDNPGTEVQADPLGDQGDYGNVIWAGDPTNSDFVVVGGIDLWRSKDSGDHFEKISAWYESPPSAHADHHIIVSQPGYDGMMNTTVYFGNDGGLYRAKDITTVGGNDGDHRHVLGWEAMNNGYGVTQFYGGICNLKTGIVFGGAQDNGTLRFAPALGPQKWTSVIGGDGGYCASDPTDTEQGRQIFYSEYVYLDLQRSLNAGIQPSGSPNPDADNISGHFWNANDPNNAHWDWKPAPFVIPDARDSALAPTNPKANFIAPFVLDPNNSDRILAGGLQLWCTNDAKTPNTDATGPTWKTIKAAIGNNGFLYSISAIAVAPGDSKTIWVAHNNGDVYKTTNGTESLVSWTPMHAMGGVPLPRRFCTRLVIDPGNVKKIYATFGGFSSGNVWVMTEGSPWKNLGAAELPPAPVRALAIHPSNPKYLYIGTEVGILTSTDGGEHWSSANQGPTNCSVDDLFWVDKTLFAVTHGRGMYKLDQSQVSP